MEDFCIVYIFLVVRLFTRHVIRFLFLCAFHYVSSNCVLLLFTGLKLLFVVVVVVAAFSLTASRINSKKWLWTFMRPMKLYQHSSDVLKMRYHFVNEMYSSRS